MAIPRAARNTMRAPLYLRTAVGNTAGQGTYTDVAVFDSSGNFTGPGLSPTGNVTIATTKTLAVTDVDKLTVGSKIIPNTFWERVSSGAAAAVPFGGVFFTATRAMKIVSVYERHATAESTAGSFTCMLKKVPSGTAASGGTDCLAAGVNMKATANTNQTPALHATAANYTLAAGDSLAIVPSGSATELAYAEFTVELQAV